MTKKTWVLFFNNHLLHYVFTEMVWFIVEAGFSAVLLHDCMAVVGAVRWAVPTLSPDSTKLLDLIFTSLFCPRFPASSWLHITITTCLATQLFQNFFWIQFAYSSTNSHITAMFWSSSIVFTESTGLGTMISHESIISWVTGGFHAEASACPLFALVKTIFIQTFHFWLLWFWALIPSIDVLNIKPREVHSHTQLMSTWLSLL